MFPIPERQLHGIGKLRHQGAAPALTFASLGTELSSHCPEPRGPDSPGPATQFSAPALVLKNSRRSKLPETSQHLGHRDCVCSNHSKDIRGSCCGVQAHLGAGLLSCLLHALAWAHTFSQCTHVLAHTWAVDFLVHTLLQGSYHHQAAWAASSPCRFKGQQFSSPSRLYFSSSP